jgi:hypothetical protein
VTGGCLDPVCEGLCHEELSHKYINYVICTNILCHEVPTSAGSPS